MPKFGIKNTLFGYFGVEFQNTIPYLKSAPLNFSKTANFCEKTKMPKFGNKNALFGYFWVRILENYCVIFEISTLNFVKLQLLNILTATK